MEEDLIFAKNRHFFGGIEPSNMLCFSLSKENGYIRITATLPNDTIISGYTLCTVGGAIIRRKNTGFPKDEFDGELVADIKESVDFIDIQASSTETHYYAAFPYTSQGVYNRNTLNRASINEPKPMKTFTAKSRYMNATKTVLVELTVALPDGVAGAVIRKSTTGYPIDETDGQAVMNISSDGVYQDKDVVVGPKYYYAAFPYTATNAYNRDKTNRACVTPVNRNYLFGYDLVGATENPSERVTYPADVDNHDYMPAAMDFETNVFKYGDWNITPGELFMPRPCMVTNTGRINCYLNPDNYAQKVDGTASRNSDTTFNGNAMMEWPKIFTKRWEENGIYHFRCSDTPQDSSWDCWCNYDRENNQIDHFYTPIYSGSLVSGKIRSISGQSSVVNLTADEEINYALANGSDWYTEVISDVLLIQDLLVMMAKTTDSQAAYGNGRVGSNVSSPLKTTGTMDNCGMFWGSSNMTVGVKVFGMENIWGNLWRRTAGWVLDDGSQLLKLTRGTHDGSTATDYNLGGTGYLKISDSTPSGQSSYNIKEMKTLPFGRIPVSSSNSWYNHYESDSMTYSNTGKYYALIGGCYVYASKAGVFAVYLYRTALVSDKTCSVALSYKPLANSD